VKLLDRDDLIALFEQYHDTILRKLAQYNTAVQSEKRARAARLAQYDVQVEIQDAEIVVSQQLTQEEQSDLLAEALSLQPDPVQERESLGELVREPLRELSSQTDSVDALASAFSSLKFGSARKSRRRWSTKESLALCQGHNQRLSFFLEPLLFVVCCWLLVVVCAFLIVFAKTNTKTKKQNTTRHFPRCPSFRQGVGQACSCGRGTQQCHRLFEGSRGGPAQGPLENSHQRH